MSLFSGKKKEIDEEIAEKILEQESPLGTLYAILNNLPSELVEWLEGLLKTHEVTRSYTEVDIARSIDAGSGIMPGDIIIKRNRDPEVGDIAEVAFRTDDGDYSVGLVKVLKINIKEGTMFVKRPLIPERDGYIGLKNIIFVIHKIIKYEDPEWKATTQLFDLDYDKEEIIDWVEEDLSYLKEHDFYDKENNIKGLTDRLENLKKNDW